MNPLKNLKPEPYFISPRPALFPALNRMPLEITYVSGNSYRIHDAFMTAEAKMLGGGDGMAIILRVIKAVEPITPGVDTSEAALIARLREGLIEIKRFRSFLVSYKGMVVASTDKDYPTGSRIPTQINWRPRQ